MSDGCTGFWLFELIWPITGCCVDHDAGGSDDALQACLSGAIPYIGAVAAAVGVWIMTKLRPMYRWFQSTWLYKFMVARGWWPKAKGE